jgi:secondary thiamine-phosphate synthase enzyme
MIQDYLEMHRVVRLADLVDLLGASEATVRRDLDAFMARLVPDGDRLFEHTDEGADDMPAHVRAVLTAADLTVPVSRGSLALGTWQGIYLWEHRRHGHQRRVTVTVQGAAA